NGAAVHREAHDAGGAAAADAEAPQSVVDPADRVVVLAVRREEVPRSAVEHDRAGGAADGVEAPAAAERKRGVGVGHVDGTAATGAGHRVRAERAGERDRTGAGTGDVEEVG